MNTKQIVLAVLAGSSLFAQSRPSNHNGGGFGGNQAIYQGSYQGSNQGNNAYASPPQSYADNSSQSGWSNNSGPYPTQHFQPEYQNHSYDSSFRGAYQERNYDRSYRESRREREEAFRHRNEFRRYRFEEFRR